MKLSVDTLSATGYVVRILVLVAVYAVVLGVSIALLIHGIPDAAVVPVSLAPMLPAFGMVLAVVRRYRSMDELQQRIMSEAILFAFGCTAVLTFSYGFLENTGRVPDLSYFWVWPVMAATWIAGNLIASRRYR